MVRTVLAEIEAAVYDEIHDAPTELLYESQEKHEVPFSWRFSGFITSL